MKATYYAANYNALTIMAPFNSFDNQTFNKKSRKNQYLIQEEET